MIPHLWAIALGAAVVAGGTAAGVVLVTSGPLAPGSADQAASVTPGAGTPSATPKVTPTPSSSDTSDTGQTPRPATPTRTASATGTVSVTASGTATATGTPTAIVRIPPDTIITGTTNFDFNALPLVDSSQWPRSTSPSGFFSVLTPQGWSVRHGSIPATMTADGKAIDTTALRFPPPTSNKETLAQPGDRLVDVVVVTMAPNLRSDPGPAREQSLPNLGNGGPGSDALGRVFDRGGGLNAGTGAVVVVRSQRLPDGRYLKVTGMVSLPARAGAVAEMVQAVAAVRVP